MSTDHLNEQDNDNFVHLTAGESDAANDSSDQERPSDRSQNLHDAFVRLHDYGVDLGLSGHED
jgi:hypothetical protein